MNLTVQQKRMLSQLAKAGLELDKQKKLAEKGLKLIRGKLTEFIESEELLKDSKTLQHCDTENNVVLTAQEATTYSVPDEDVAEILAFLNTTGETEMVVAETKHVLSKEAKKRLIAGELNSLKPLLNASKTMRFSFREPAGKKD